MLRVFNVLGALRPSSGLDKVDRPKDLSGLNEMTGLDAMSEIKGEQDWERAEMNDAASTIALRMARPESPRVAHARRVKRKSNNLNVRWLSTRNRMIGQVFNARTRLRKTAMETNAVVRIMTSPKDGTMYRIYLAY